MSAAPRVLQRPPVPAVLARPLAGLYGRLMARRNRRFDARKGVIEFDRPTISVGNLSVGGTGKTPMVQRVIGLLRDAGHRPCIAMRGYRSAGGESDEAAEYARLFPDVPVVARADRVEGLIALFGTDRGREVDSIVLDDGFQHRRVARDLDVVLIDVTRDPFADALLPLGWLREPVGSLARAGAVVLTHAEGVDEPTLRAIASRVPAVAAGAAVAVCEHAWTGLRVVDKGQERTEGVEWLRGRASVVSCAIGNPGPFLARAAGATGRAPGAVLVLRDHDPFAPGTVRALARAAAEHHASVILVTEKDWSKLRRVEPDRWPCPVVRPRLELRFREGAGALDALVLGAVRARPYVPVEEFLGMDEDGPASESAPSP